MTLHVNIFVRDVDGNVSVINADAHAHELAGFELCRRTLYSGVAAQLFGLQLFPTLATQNLFIDGDQLDQLHKEAQTILQNVSLFAQHAELDTSYVTFRIKNILRAIDQTVQVNGGVVIW